jgi:LPS export ABC transporter protein LptC
MFTQAQETLIDSNLKLDFFNPQQIKTTTLTSKRGRVDDKTRNLYAIENVVAVNDSGITLETEELMWRNSDSKIVSDKFVTITTPTERIQGYGFESDQHLKNYIIYKVTYITTSDSL